MAKALGSVLGNRKDLRLTVMASLRKLILWSSETNNENDIKEIGRFAKNYLPILFNLYTTPAKGSEEEGIRLAALETIMVTLLYQTIISWVLKALILENLRNKLSLVK